MRFVDTNVLLYAISRDRGERAQATRANELLTGRDLGLSVQVLQEFYVQATRAGARNSVSHDQAVGLVESFRRFRVTDVTAEIMEAACSTCARFKISYWDAAILEAARTLRCEIVLSEDMNHGQDYDGVVVENPFLNS